MKNKFLPCVCDSVLSGFITFLVADIFLRAVISSSAAVIVLSIVFGISVCALLFLFLVKKNKLESIKSKSAKKLNDILSELEIMPDNRLIDLFLPLFKNKKIIKIENGSIETECEFFTFDYYEKTDRERAVKIKRSSNGKKTILFCNVLTSDCAEFCKKNDVTVYDKSVLPSLQEKYGLEFPQREAAKTSVTMRRRIKNKLFSLATFKRAASLALSSAALFLFAEISFFPKWYKLSGVVLLAFAALLSAIRIATKKQPPSNEKNELLN